MTEHRVVDCPACPADFERRTGTLAPGFNWHHAQLSIAGADAFHVEPAQTSGPSTRTHGVATPTLRPAAPRATYYTDD